VRRIDVHSARQMHAAVLTAAPQTDIYIGAAAVGDYRPAHAAEHKLKKQGDEGITLALVQNPDILASLAVQEPHPFLVGFAAETDAVADYAQDKLRRKGLDMIAANQVGAGMGIEVADNALQVLWPGGSQSLPRASKEELARDLVASIAQRYRASRP